MPNCLMCRPGLGSKMDLKLYLNSDHLMIHHIPEVTEADASQGLRTGMYDSRLHLNSHYLTIHNIRGEHTVTDIRDRIVRHLASIEAALKSGIEAAEHLLDKGVNPDDIIRLAAAGGRLEILTLLLDKGGDPNGGATGWTAPITSAAEEGRFQAVKLLLDRGGRSERLSLRKVYAHLTGCQIKSPQNSS